MNSKTILILVVVILGIGGLVFFSGNPFSSSQVTQNDSGSAQTNLQTTTSTQQQSQQNLQNLNSQVEQQGDIMSKQFSGPEQVLEQGKNYTALFRTNKGDITIDLYQDQMPETVNNFVFLSQQGYYDGVIFHRVIPGFMVQGGDPTGTGRGGPGYAIDDEFVAGPTNTRGTISMANAGPNTGGSQFFINVADNVFLDWNNNQSPSAHPVFGEVVDGMDVVDSIVGVPTSGADRPVEDVVITKLEIFAQ